MPAVPELAIAAALAWGSGVRLYATLFLVGLAGHWGWVELPHYLLALQNPLVLAASGVMACVEFFADKIPWVDSVWDALHSFIRIPAGAALAAAVFGDTGAGGALAAAILGGGVAAGTHFSKAGARALLNTSPEPFSNWAASFTEDAALPAGLWLAVMHPLVFLACLLMLALIAVIFLRWILRGLKLLYRRFSKT